MEKAVKEKKERRYHLVRKQNPNTAYKFSVRFASILISFFLIIILFSLIGKFNLGQTITYMWDGAFGNFTNSEATSLNMMMLFVLALALAPAFKMKYWNIGALGQALIGNMFASLVVYKLGPHIPNNFLLLLIALIVAIAGGAIWGLIPGIFKAKFNANETLFTLMMNYVAIQLVKVVIEYLKDGAQSLVPSIYGRFDYIGNWKYGWVYIIAILVALFVFIYLKYTKHGYEIAVLGESRNTAKYAGINTSLVTMRTAAISGALCAICGFIFTGTSCILSTESDGGYGFTSIIVTWSSHFSVMGMFVISFLIAFLKKGSDGVKNKASSFMNDYASYISIGIFLFFLIGCEFFLNYKFLPNSELAKKQQAKKEKLRADHPGFYAWYDATKLSVYSFFMKVTNIFNKVKNAIASFFNNIILAIKSFFIKVGSLVAGFFRKLFSKKGAE